MKKKASYYGNPGMEVRYFTIFHKQSLLQNFLLRCYQETDIGLRHAID